jgi:hypothetical protein
VLSTAKHLFIMLKYAWLRSELALNNVEQREGLTGLDDFTTSEQSTRQLIITGESGRGSLK